MAALPPAGNGALAQTAAQPSATAAAFDAEMRATWQAIRTGDVSLAAPAFFPQAAYLQLKTLPDDASDWRYRLVEHFDLDIAAAHRQLGTDASAATYVTVIMPPADDIGWIPPGSCYNQVGYWHAPGARLVYEVRGQERSVGIASLISWRGYWYVVHLGTVMPPVGVGVVDEPAIGTGYPSPLGGC